MTLLSDRQLIAVARKYNLSPDSVKCKIFALFDQGYSAKEIRYLLRQFRNPEYPRTVSLWNHTDHNPHTQRLMVQLSDEMFNDFSSASAQSIVFSWLQDESA